MRIIRCIVILKGTDAKPREHERQRDHKTVLMLGRAQRLAPTDVSLTQHHPFAYFVTSLSRVLGVVMLLNQQKNISGSLNLTMPH